MPRMFLPPGPMRAPIFSGLIWMTLMRGAWGESSARGAGRTDSMKSRIFMRATRSRSIAFSTRSHVRPRILRSTWKPVMPSRVPPILKSMSPQWSSAPRMSVTRIALLSSGVVKRPHEMPATGFLIGMPASIIARVPTQIDAIDEEPFEPMISETMRTA